MVVSWHFLVLCLIPGGSISIEQQTWDAATSLAHLCQVLHSLYIDISFEQLSICLKIHKPPCFMQSSIGAGQLQTQAPWSRIIAVTLQQIAIMKQWQHTHNHVWKLKAWQHQRSCPTRLQKHPSKMHARRLQHSARQCLANACQQRLIQKLQI